eukprot:ctg_507.g129
MSAARTNATKNSLTGRRIQKNSGETPPLPRSRSAIVRTGEAPRLMRCGLGRSCRRSSPDTAKGVVYKAGPTLDWSRVNEALRRDQDHPESLHWAESARPSFSGLTGAGLSTPRDGRAPMHTPRRRSTATPPGLAMTLWPAFAPGWLSSAPAAVGRAETLLGRRIGEAWRWASAPCRAHRRLVCAIDGVGVRDSGKQTLAPPPSSPLQRPLDAVQAIALE